MGPESPDLADLAASLKEHVLGGLSPELALDLVLNELVVRAADATQASAAALALVRGDAMVCRATTGANAPDLGIPLSMRDGLSGACLTTREPQLSRDTESDPRVDPDVSQRLGVRSILVVPIFEGGDLAGIIETFSPQPEVFSETDQVRLEAFARDCTQLRGLARDLEANPPQQQNSEVEALLADAPELSVLARKPWIVPDPGVLILAVMVLAAAAGLSFLYGFRVGVSPALTSPHAAETALPVPPAPQAPQPEKPVQPVHSPSHPSAEGGLVVYERGKVIFRMQPATGVPVAGETLASLSGKSEQRWLAPEVAETRLRQRVEPVYPADALAAHRSGDVMLEVLVRGDGSVASVRAISGDPTLAAAAADAVRNWRYEPYRQQGTPTEFQTDVTLTFALPN